MEHSKTFRTFAPETYKLIIMLGIDSKETPVVTGTYANEIREAVRRAHLGQLNDSDRDIAARSANIKREYDVVWK